MFVPTGTASVTSLAWSGRTGESLGKIRCREDVERERKKNRRWRGKGGGEEGREEERGRKTVYNLYVPVMGRSTFEST